VARAYETSMAHASCISFGKSDRSFLPTGAVRVELFPTWRVCAVSEKVFLEAFTSWRKTMTKWIAVAFALAFATSAQAATATLVHQPAGSMVTHVAYACGPGRTRVGGVCVARTTIRHTRRNIRRCARWHGGVCVRYY